MAKDYNPQFTAPAGALRKVNTSRDEFRREEQRLDRRAPRIKKPERKSMYEKLLDKAGY